MATRRRFQPGWRTGHGRSSDSNRVGVNDRFDRKPVRFSNPGHAAGALVAWDLAHAAGNVEMALHDWEVDAAAWCTYKYLNGGPGSVGALFIHERHGRDPTIPRLAGWWGADPDRRFSMDAEFLPAAGAAGWKASTNPVLALAPLATSLAIFDDVGMPVLRARSLALTGYLAGLLEPLPIEVITPADPTARGAQLSLRVDDAPAVLACLVARGVVADVRAPDILRVAPVPLYNTYRDAWRLARFLREAVERAVQLHPDRADVSWPPTTGPAPWRQPPRREALSPVGGSAEPHDRRPR